MRILHYKNRPAVDLTFLRKMDYIYTIFNGRGLYHVIVSTHYEYRSMNECKVFETKFDSNKRNKTEISTLQLSKIKLLLPQMFLTKKIYFF